LASGKPIISHKAAEAQRRTQKLSRVNPLGLSWMRGALAAALALAAVPAACQQAPLSDEIVAVKARRIETVSKGVIENGIILLRNGKIVAIGTKVKIPVDARVITADTVMPGIVAPYSLMGLSAAGGDAPVQLPARIPPALAARFAGAAGGRSSANTHYRVLDELYPFEEAYAQLPRAGVTTLALVPEGRGFGGQGAVIKPSGDTAEKMALAQTSPFAINFQQDSQTQDLIRATLQGGAATGQGGPGGSGRFGNGGGPGGGGFEADTEDDFQRRQGRQAPRPGGFAPNAPSSFTAAARRVPITRAMAGEIPTFITCTDATATVYALNLFQAFDKLNAVYILPLDCYRVADMLGQKKASVIIQADTTFEPNTRNRVNTAAILAKAGVKIACRPLSDNIRGYEGLFFKMGELIRLGLDRETALKSITLNPAEMLGVSDRVGSIEVGRDGNLLLLDGDPFSPLTKVSRVLLEGKTVYDGK
jgi:hypothetical protein